jgi:hypothetical protein
VGDLFMNRGTVAEYCLNSDKPHLHTRIHNSWRHGFALFETSTLQWGRMEVDWI